MRRVLVPVRMGLVCIASISALPASQSEMNKLCWLLRLVDCELVGKPGVKEHKRPRHHIVEVYFWRSDSDLVICHKEVIHYLAWPGIGEDRERPALWNIQEIQPTHLRVGVDMRLVRTHAGHLLRPHT